jgi:hypothetical protein
MFDYNPKMDDKKHDLKHQIGNQQHHDQNYNLPIWDCLTIMKMKMTK